MNERLRSNYRIINFIFAGIIMAVIGYSVIFSADGRRHPLPSGPGMFTGNTSPSTGLSRSFSAIVRLQFTEAAKYNPHGIRIFAFFIAQLFLRLSISFRFLRADRINIRRVLFADVLVSGVMFLTLFRPFLAHLIRQFIT